MSKLVAFVRSLAAKVRASVPFGQYIPNNKLIAGALASGVTLALTKLGIVDIPAGYVSVGAFAVVSYLLPESPVAAAHVVAKAGQAVLLKRRMQVDVPVYISDVAKATAADVVAQAQRDFSAVPNAALAAIVPPQS